MSFDFAKIYKNLPLPIKASVWYTVCSVLQKSISIITAPIFTRIMSESDYGQVNIYNSWLNILTMCLTLALYGGMFNKAMIQFEDDRDRFISSMQGLVFSLMAGWSVVYLLAQDFWNGVLGLSTTLVVVMLVEITLQPSLQFWSNKQRFEYHYKTYAFVTALSFVINPIIGIVAVLHSTNKGQARILSSASVTIVFCSFICILNFAKGRQFYNKKYWRYALAFNIPLIPYYISQSLFTQTDRIMIGRLAGEDKAGMYSLVLNFSTVLNFIITAIEGSLTPWLYQHIQAEKYGEVRKVSKELVILVSILLFSVTLIGPEAIAILAPPVYQQAVGAIPPLVGGMLGLFFGKLAGSMLFYYEQRAGLLMATTASAIANILLNYLLIPRVGFIVAGYTTLLAYFVSSAILCVCLYKKVTECKQFYDMRFFGKYAIAYTAVTLSVTLLYPHPLLRYLCLLLACGLAFAFRQKIKQIAQNFIER